MKNYIKLFFEILEKDLTNYSFDGNEISGEINISNKIYNKLEELYKNNLLDHLLKIDGQNVDIKSLNFIGSESKNAIICLKPEALLAESIKYYNTLDDFLIENFVKSPSFDYYIYDLKYLSNTSDTIPLALQNYKKIQGIINVLRTISDYITETHPYPQFIYFQKIKLELLIKYNATILNNFNFEYDLSKEVLTDDENKRLIFKSVLIESISNIPLDNNFSFFLQNIKTIFDRFKHSYEIYLNKFDLQQIRDEFNRQKLEYIKKLNGLITEIQNKILAIPIAFILVASQLDNTHSFSFKNLIILIGSFIFSILLHILLINQKYTLEDIRSDILSFKNKINKSPEIFAFFKSDFISLENKCNRQNMIILFVMYVVWAVSFISLFLFLLYTFDLGNLSKILYCIIEHW